MKRGFKKIEFIIAFALAVLLVASLLSEQYLNLPPQLTSLLILAFILVKLIDIVKIGGTIFEDYVSLALIVIFGVVHFFMIDKINPAMIVAAVFILVYSTGLIPSVDDLVKSKRVAYFIFSYGFFILIIIFLFAGAYFANAEDFTFHQQKTNISFEDSLYFSTVTFTTVGYGEISPIGINKLISSIEAISGMVLNIAFVGYILSSRRFK